MCTYILPMQKSFDVEGADGSSYVFFKIFILNS